MIWTPPYTFIISVEHWRTGSMSPYLKLQSSYCTYEYMKVLNASFLVYSTPQNASDVCHHPFTHINLLLASSHLLIYRDNHSSFIHKRCRMWSFIWNFMYYSRNSDTHKDPQNVSPELSTSKNNPVYVNYTVFDNISIYLQVAWRNCFWYCWQTQWASTQFWSRFNSCKGMYVVIWIPERYFYLQITYFH